MQVLLDEIKGTYDGYVLTNRDDVTWDDIEGGTISSDYNDYIDYAEVYNIYEWRSE